MVCAPRADIVHTTLFLLLYQALLEPFGTVVSCRILRDYYTQASRGVGFARMQSREVCDKILASFNGVKLEGTYRDVLGPCTPLFSTGMVWNPVV